MSEKTLNRTAFALSVGIHLLLLFFALPTPKSIEIPPEKQALLVPVQFVLQEAPAPKPAPPKKRVVKKQALKKPKPKPKPKVKKPTALPGDRKAPVVKGAIAPRWPKRALNEELEGRVTATFYIDESGKPTRYKINKSSGHDILDIAFTRTVMTYYSFSPKRVMGKDESGQITLSYNFTLSGDSQ